MLPALDGYEIAVARNKVLTPYQRGDALADENFSLWLRRHGEALWDFEMVAEAQQDGQWVYRREALVTRPLDEVFVRARDFPIIAPEIQLLYKCKEPRPKDIDDLERCVPLLEAAAYAWLREAAATAHPAFLPTLETMRR